MKKTLLTTLAVASSLAFACVANAAENNPFGLVYKGAIMENVKGKVNIHPVTYTLNGLKIAANVYTPAGYEATKKYPAVVVAHPNGGVKEQVAGLYAQRLAKKAISPSRRTLPIREPVRGLPAMWTSLSSARRTSTAWPTTSAPIPA